MLPHSPHSSPYRSYVISWENFKHQDISSSIISVFSLLCLPQHRGFCPGPSLYHVSFSATRTELIFHFEHPNQSHIQRQAYKKFRLAWFILVRQKVNSDG